MTEYTLQFVVMKRVRANNPEALLRVQKEARLDVEQLCSEDLDGFWSTRKGNAKLVRVICHRKPIAKTRKENRHR